MTKKLSIIVPCYYEEETITLFYEAVEKVKKEQPAPQPEVKIEEAKSDSEEKPVEEKKKKGLFRRK